MSEAKSEARIACGSSPSLCRLPSYERTLDSIDAYIDAIEASASVLAWSPPLSSGGYASLPPSVESRCKHAVLRALRESRADIAEYLDRVKPCETA